MKSKTERKEAAKRLKDTAAKLSDRALDRLLGYAEGIAAAQAVKPRDRA